MSTRRLLKAAEAVREVVSMAILTEVRDPRVRDVTVTGVDDSVNDGDVAFTGSPVLRASCSRESLTASRRATRPSSGSNSMAA